MRNRKENQLRRLISIATIVLPVIVCSSCSQPAQQTGGPGKTQRYLLGFDFDRGQTLRYEFVSERDIAVDFGASETDEESDSARRSSERLELVMAYEPVEVDEFGFATVKVTCESAKARRVSISGRTETGDPVTTARGKSFLLKITPAGRLEDKADFAEFLRQLGEAAFRGPRGSTPKDPDMIFDLIATQLYFWDSISSIENPAEGVAVGDTWKSTLLAPLPIPKPVPRNVTYALAEVTTEGSADRAMITSDYSLGTEPMTGFPMPYTGSFRMRGMFGFFRGYEVLELAGDGRQIFNVDAGRIESGRQQYRLTLSAAMPGSRGSSLGSGRPAITINQTFTTRLLNE